MEINDDLKNLYRHWQQHTDKPPSSGTKTFNSKMHKEMIGFANKRMMIYEEKEKGNSPPYSSDPILNKFRFCNIYRELDRQTIFYHKFLRHIRSNFPLWLLDLSFCRFICNTETIEKIGLPSFHENKNTELYQKLLQLPSPKYGNAYIFPISIIQKSKYDTREKFLCFYLPKVIKEVARQIENFNKESVSNVLPKIIELFGFNFRFHWTEILIDVAYQYPDKIDLFKQFPIGPGALPTIKQINDRKTPEEVCLTLTHTVPDNFNYLELNGEKVYLSTENWEGICCEFRKYKNLLNGKGRKRLYK
jgi:hypothetical protein